MLYVPPWKGVALIVPPEAAYGLVVAGAIGIVVGVARGWGSRSRQLGGVAAGTGSDPKGEAMLVNRRTANAIALAGIVLALIAVWEVGTVFVIQPMLVQVQG